MIRVCAAIRQESRRLSQVVGMLQDDQRTIYADRLATAVLCLDQVHRALRRELDEAAGFIGERTSHAERRV